ncbi:MAG: hypothetical protein A2521_14085 [Deltaproteobacteria bacterium RIFOXYD12_FULL_57_12]|nr:MAG: hypothetical protein A2521_14085 [Deltaproteobacteria bacterium RIFOXYD12_FULL_57_12]
MKKIGFLLLGTLWGLIFFASLLSRSDGFSQPHNPFIRALLSPWGVSLASLLVFVILLRSTRRKISDRPPAS